MRQSAFTIVTPVLPGEDTALSDLLRELDDAVNHDPPLGLAGLDCLHYASFSVVASVTGGNSLVFEGNVDGTPSDFLEHLLDVSGPDVDEVYRHCDGYPSLADGDRAAALRYLCTHELGAGTSYVALPGQTVDLILREDGLRRWIQDFLDQPEQKDLRKADAAAIHQAVIQAVRGEPSLDWALREEPLPFLVRLPQMVPLLPAPARGTCGPRRGRGSCLRGGPRGRVRRRPA